MRRLALALLIVAIPSAARAQWKSIGKTSRDGSEMFVRQSSIKRGGDTVSALILTRFAQPTYDAVHKDTLRALTTMTTFDCRREKVKVTESVYYVNFDKSKISTRSKPKVPGYQAVFGAAYPIAFASLCKAK
jgi:hypothetical protein